MRLILIRHTSVDVPRGVCYGQTDVPLAATFPTEAAAVRCGLASLVPDAVYTSPLSRCVRLAEYCGYPDAVRDPRLMEMDFGDWEMCRYDEITDPRLEQWYADYIDTPATGGESSADQRRRLESFIADLRERHDHRATIGIFTHGGMLIHASVLYGGRTLAEAFASAPPYGAIMQIEL